MDNVQKRQEAIIQDFMSVSSWEDRYKKVIAMGKELAPLSPEMYDDKFLVKGCQSQVWLHARKTPEGKIEFLGDSDAMIVKGLVAILLKVYSQATPDDILSHPPKFIGELGFQSHLSPSRANGLMSMVKQIMLYATALKALESV